jgi:hypothetical protein
MKIMQAAALKDETFLVPCSVYVLGYFLGLSCMEWEGAEVFSVATEYRG